MNSETKQCQNCKKNFTIELEDVVFYEKMGVPSPVLCPDCRMKRKFTWRNERTLYKSKCGLCSRSIVTMYNPKSPYVVYCNDCWISDKWDPSSYAKEYDTQKSFFEQLGELTKKVPKSASYSSAASGPNINSEYSNFAGGNKNCYLVFNSGPRNEDCAYARGLMKSRDAYDVYYGDEVERVYECVNVHKSAGVVWADHSTECLDSWFLRNCVSCQNCFGCVNLRHKSYHFFNEELPKDEWKSKVLDIIGSYRNVAASQKRFKEHCLKFGNKENNNFKSNNCIGDYIFESQNCFSCFETSLCEDSKYLFAVKVAKDCYDLVGHGRQSELLLEGVGTGLSQRVTGTWWVENSHDVEYSIATRSSEYCIGCDGVKNAKYRILNKEYTEDEYKKLRSHIIEELKSKSLYGLFLPPEISFFAYNETIGQDNLPMTKEESSVQGFRWEYDIPRTKGQETLAPESISDHIKDTPDTILNEILRCVKCGFNYRIIRGELELYRKLVIPIPRKCINCRYEDRLVRRGPFTLYSRTCKKCNKPIQTTYSPERPEIVYCEQCYQSEVI